MSSGGKASGTKRKQLQHHEWLNIQSYILNNMKEVKPYIQYVLTYFFPPTISISLFLTPPLLIAIENSLGNIGG
jgi:hypothetical protein